ncbi:DUF4349 domain-containing protein [Paenibacillus flagellatus]|uniref:DUF4349 domain-containing protein n=1 Tax=Paenibacillus flagellatus TaxID=2211139 RepID=UPI0013050FE0|nr:DUF4349 domain-containing protein [Paenibacillus flagellatus]
MKRTIGGRQKLAATAACALLLGALAGCGSSEDKTSSGADASAPQASAAQQSVANRAADQAAPGTAAKQDAKSEGAAAAEKPQSGAGAGAQPPGGSVVDMAEAAPARQIIYKANVTMEVTDYGAAHTDINNLIHLSGGYLMQFSENRTDYEQSGTLVVKVPSNGFTGFLADLEKMKPKSIQRSVQGQDVTEEYVDLSSRLKAKETEEARLLSFMEKATKSDELVAFSSQLGSVQAQIEQIKGRMRYLEQNVAYSTIEIRLYQKIEKAKAASENVEDGFAGKLSKALGGGAGVVVGFFQALLIALAAALPVAAVLLVVGIPAFLVWRSRRKRAAEREERSRLIRLQNRDADGIPEGESASRADTGSDD